MSDEDPGDPDGAPLSEIAEPEQEFDQELGKKMGDAAQKVRSGEMTEAEFYEQFHDQVVEEFGFDDRPVNPTED